jgi:hypothetical protein
VVTEREKFVPGFRAVTEAFATTAPVESFTVPCRSAAFEFAWPRAMWAERRRTINKQEISIDPFSRDFNDTNIVFSPLVFRGSGIRAVTVNCGSTFCRGHVL